MLIFQINHFNELTSPYLSDGSERVNPNVRKTIFITFHKSLLYRFWENDTFLLKYQLQGLTFKREKDEQRNIDRNIKIFGTEFFTRISIDVN